MQRKSVFVLILVSIASLYLLAGCKAGIELAKAQELSYKWYQTSKKRGPDADKLWGLKGAKIYGFECPYLNIMGFSHVSSYGEVAKVSDNPSKYQGKATCWLTGIDASGSKVKFQRDIELVLTYDAATKTWSNEPKFSNDRPLNTWGQIKSWLLATFLGPIAIFIIMVIIINADSFQGRLYAGMLITGIATLPWVGYTSYSAFGTGWSVVLGIIVYLLIGLLMLPILLFIFSLFSY